MFKVYLDDSRCEPKGWLRVTCVENCIEILEQYPYEVSEISLDHDLDDFVDTRNGESKELTGYEVAKWLEEKAFEGSWSYVPRILRCHSDNPDGRKRIIQAFQSIARFREEYESKLKPEKKEAIEIKEGAGQKERWASFSEKAIAEDELGINVNEKAE
jgi:hypothetical protein